tara:strand:+ start:2170 stop:2538 length:369 start_codon:yes stop_codon:yes gene_type:complete
MKVENLVLLYHPNCKASTDLIVKTKDLKEVNVDTVDISQDEIETDLEIDVVPLIIVDQDPNKVFKGKDAFDKIDQILETSKSKNAFGKSGSGGLKYGSSFNFVEEESSDKKQSIDLSKGVKI